MLTTQVTLTEQQTQALGEIAQRTGRTEADVIVEAVGQFLTQQTPCEESGGYASLDFWDNPLDDEDWNNT